MLSNFLQKSSLFHRLKQIDFDLSEHVRKQGCPYCGGALHYANYPRKPRGGPDDIPEDCSIRYSLCCAEPSCRKRTLPPSCLFWERKVYLRCFIVVAMTSYQNGFQGTMIAKLSRMLDVSRQTIKRWITYFRDEFPQGPTWKKLRGRIIGSIGNANLPGALVQYFLKCISIPEEALIACLRFLTTGLFDP